MGVSYPPRDATFVVAVENAYIIPQDWAKPVRPGTQLNCIPVDGSTADPTLRNPGKLASLEGLGSVYYTYDLVFF